MPNVWVVRADSGAYTEQFLEGGYVGVSWGIDHDLSDITTTEELKRYYRDYNPHRSHTPLSVAVPAGQLARFLWEIQPGDYVLTPKRDSQILIYGKVMEEPYYYAGPSTDHPQPHRRRVQWAQEELSRTNFSSPAQEVLRAWITVFKVPQREEFLQMIGQADSETSQAPPVAVPSADSPFDAYGAALERILRLSPQEFEELTLHLLAAIGFVRTERTGGPWDGGVDVTGVWNAHAVRVRVFVQVKRYQLDSPISASAVTQLRQRIPQNEQGVFVTTSRFTQNAVLAADEQGYPRINLIDGRQVVDLLIEHWDRIPEAFRDVLGLRKALVPA